MQRVFFFALFKETTWQSFPKYLQDEISDPKGKAETRQVFGDTIDLGNIFWIILYWNYPTLGHPEEVIHLNREYCIYLNFPDNYLAFCIT